MSKDMWSKKFDPDGEFVARRALTLGDGSSLSPGDEIPKAALPTRRLRQLYDQRTIVFGDVWNTHTEEPAPYVEKTPTLTFDGPDAQTLTTSDAPLLDPTAPDVHAPVVEPIIETEDHQIPLATLPGADEPVITLPGLPGLPGLPANEPEIKTDGESA